MVLIVPVEPDLGNVVPEVQIVVAGAGGVEAGGEDCAVLLVPPSQTVRSPVTALSSPQTASASPPSLTVQRRLPTRSSTQSQLTVVLAVNIEVAPLAGQVTLRYIQCKVEIRCVTTLSIDILLLHIMDKK